MTGQLAAYLRRRVGGQILALLALLTAMMQVLELLDVTTEILERGQGVGEAPMAEFKAQKAAAVAIAEAQDLWTPHRPERNWDKFEGGKKFRVASSYEPAGDQPQAIEKLVASLRQLGHVLAALAMASFP